MKIQNNTGLKITENLLKLERGSDELLLANYLHFRPLYINKGKKYIANFLKATSELCSYKNIINAFPQDIDLLDTLINHEIIVPRLQEDSKIPKDSSERLSLDNRRGTSLYLLLSQSCNMGCVYCLNGIQSYQKDKNLKMSKKVAFRSIERCLDDIRPGGYLEIIFFGGEPLLNWPLAKEIIVHCENVLKEKHPGKHIKYHITSNLSFLPKDVIDWAKKFNITFLCDIDGPENIHNVCRPFRGGGPTHSTIVRNIERLIGAELKVDLRTTITALNQDHLLETTKHHKAIGAASSAFVPVNPVNSDEDILDNRLLPSPHKIIKGMTDVYKSKVWGEEDLFPFNQYASRLIPGRRMFLGCGAPYGNTPVVDINGAVYPCIYLVGIKRYYMGNIMNESYPNKNLLQSMFYDLHVDYREDCKSCAWRYLCGGSCPLGRLTVFNNPAASDKVTTYCKIISCEYTKKMIELLLWDKAQEAAQNLLENQGVGHTIDKTIHC
jgi:uncharacterized protein